MATTCHGKLDLRHRIQDIIHRNKHLGDTNLKHEAVRPLSTSTPNKAAKPDKAPHKQIVCKVSPRVNTGGEPRETPEHMSDVNDDVKPCAIDSISHTQSINQLSRNVDAVVSGETGSTSGFTDSSGSDVISNVSEVMASVSDIISGVSDTMGSTSDITDSVSDVTDNLSEEWTGDTFILGSPQCPVATILDQKFSASVTARIQEVIDQLTRQSNTETTTHSDANTLDTEGSPWTESPIDCGEELPSSEKECICEQGISFGGNARGYSVEQISSELWPVLSHHLALAGNNQPCSQQEFLHHLRQQQQQLEFRQQQQHLQWKHEQQQQQQQLQQQQQRKFAEKYQQHQLHLENEREELSHTPQPLQVNVISSQSLQTQNQTSPTLRL